MVTLSISRPMIEHVNERKPGRVILWHVDYVKRFWSAHPVPEAIKCRTEITGARTQLCGCDRHTLLVNHAVQAEHVEIPEGLHFWHPVPANRQTDDIFRNQLGDEWMCRTALQRLALPYRCAHDPRQLEMRQANVSRCECGHYILTSGDSEIALKMLAEFESRNPPPKPEFNQCWRD